MRGSKRLPQWEYALEMRIDPVVGEQGFFWLKLSCRLEKNDVLVLEPVASPRGNLSRAILILKPSSLRPDLPRPITVIARIEYMDTNLFVQMFPGASRSAGH